MLVSRRLGKLISGADDSLIPFYEEFSTAEGEYWRDHSHKARQQRDFGARFCSVVAERSLGVWASWTCLLRRGLSKVSCSVSDG